MKNDCRVRWNPIPGKRPPGCGAYDRAAPYRRHRIGGGEVIALLGLVLGFLAPMMAAAAEPAGVVVAVRGKVEATHQDGSKSILALKDKVFQNDVIHTGARGRIQIAFNDDTILNLGRKTRIQLTECVFDRSTGQGALRLNIREGVFRLVGGAIMKVSPENFKAETPTATIGIRGSSFVAEITAQLTKVVLLGTTGGGIEISNDDGYRIVYIPGTGLEAPLGRALGRVRKMDAVALALLGRTSVGGATSVPNTDVEGQKDEEEEEEDDEGEGQGASVDPFDIIPGYQTYADARKVLQDALRNNAPFSMTNGNAIGLDTAYDWALRSLEPDDVSLTISLRDGEMDGVIGGGMILHTEGTGDPADTFPEGPVTTPPIPFTFVDGHIEGNDAIRVTDSRIETPDGAPDVSNWGWWEMDITDPNAETTPHHVVGLWQGTALIKTAAEWVESTLLGRDFVGTYAGDAHALRNGVDRLDGASSLSLRFRDNTFTGSLDFTGDGGPAMDLNGSINRDGIHGRVSAISGEEGPISSSMRGFFYGSEAESIQGAFDARNATNRYIGIMDAAGGVSPSPSLKRHKHR